MAMPEVVTHRYDPLAGPFLNICDLADFEAMRVLERLRRKPDYLTRRRATEEWLSASARERLGRRIIGRPSYFFLGDFTHGADASRPAALVVPLSTFPADAMTFTLGDSMSVVERKVYKVDEVGACFRDGFAFSDRDGFQRRFIEMQLWRDS